MAHLIGWLHLSDIHFGDGSTAHQLDKEQVLERLIEDLEFLVTSGAVTIDYVLITGDITYSGGRLSDDEFDRAEVWLRRVLATVGLTPDRLLAIPGNHDASVHGEDDDDLRYVLESLRRSGGESIDNLSTAYRDLLVRRFMPYNRFASKFGGPSSPLGSPLHWWREIASAAVPELKIAIAGLNTAATTALGDNQGHLQLGQTPLAEWERRGARRKIVFALTHHPLTPDWLLDYPTVHQRFEQRVDVHLAGHVHELDVETLRRGERKPMLTVVSGAVHGAEREEVSHGYSLGELMADDGEAVVRVWPRYFYPSKQEFDRHAELLPRGADYSEHPLGGKAKHLVQQHVGTLTRIRTSPASVRGRMDDLDSLIGAIDEPDLLKFATDVVAETHGSLRRLALMKQTPELTAGAYYTFLLPLIEAACAGSSIWAISTMMTVEWTDDPYEVRFLRANLEAADRGVAVERIFVVASDQFASILDNPAVRAQVDHPAITTLVVIRERLEATDVRLLGRIGPGLIAFGEELVVVDRHNEDGRARGYGTYLADEISSWKRTYLELREHATDLTAEIAGLNRNQVGADERR